MILKQLKQIESLNAVVAGREVKSFTPVFDESERCVGVLLRMGDGHIIAACYQAHKVVEMADASIWTLMLQAEESSIELVDFPAFGEMVNGQG